MKIKQTHHIYGIFNDKTNELIYVGSTSDVMQRAENHKHTTCKSFKDSFRVEILESCDSNRYESESFWINNMLFLGCKLQNKTRLLNTHRKIERNDNKSLVTIVLPVEILKHYGKLAKKKGMSLNMFCASMLCEWAEVPEK